MSKTFRKDLTGQRFGRLTVLEFVPNNKNKSYWKCQCDCGNITIVKAMSLKSSNTKSCGCINLKHGLTKTRLFNIWCGIKSRCYNQNIKDYKNYGGRGIIVCDEWKNNFKAFYDWSIQNGYDDALTIDRIDVNGNYTPNNCKWISNIEQNRNTRRNILVEYLGKEMCLAEVARYLNINRVVLYDRYKRGDRGARLFRPVKTK